MSTLAHVVRGQAWPQRITIEPVSPRPVEDQITVAHRAAGRIAERGRRARACVGVSSAVGAKQCPRRSFSRRWCSRISLTRAATPSSTCS